MCQNIDVHLAPGVSDAIDEAYALASRLPEGLFDLVKRRFFFGSGPFGKANANELTAMGARKWSYTLQLSDGFLDLLAALRAGNAERYLAEVEASHDSNSISKAKQG